ncbi:hypothetical protein E3E12_01620 [Formicincola oecophyllae]|uniref:Uncharacterized protein n=1 Tax=Formicincola oecophyllae TaxID=2558361 RepID=A0A4Y6U968_9PROT|nr:hypothetical protein [Formicincola oecophyllae]QDH13108.1 hypothetical protein E3E12_01620 [Formicincola oecophyllae]
MKSPASLLNNPPHSMGRGLLSLMAVVFSGAPRLVWAAGLPAAAPQTTASGLHGLNLCLAIGACTLAELVSILLIAGGANTGRKMGLLAGIALQAVALWLGAKAFGY